MFVYRVHHKETLEGPYTPTHCSVCKSIGKEISSKHNKNLKQWPAPNPVDTMPARKNVGLSFRSEDWGAFIFGFDSLSKCLAWFKYDIDLLNRCDFVVSQYIVDEKYVQSFTEGKQLAFNVNHAWIRTQYPIIYLGNF